MTIDAATQGVLMGVDRKANALWSWFEYCSSLEADERAHWQEEPQ